jgi:hypothetical protein
MPATYPPLAPSIQNISGLRQGSADHSVLSSVCSKRTGQPRPNDGIGTHEAARGVLIVFLVITGSVWIIANLNNNMMPMPAQ